MNCSKVDSSSKEKEELLWKLAILVSYFLQIRLKSLPSALEALPMTPSFFLLSWLIRETS